ncbi:hypothetical protein [Fimbriiglobus ruber]|uniref:Uncharacterized protein n=1 Tax=Fimbriiglobus ruber TaxID=1908690 RepID=A0A225DGT0_9BACT|nr:hypothetical protein [Fimbriiglobus ruber]OWK35317.1 hypothetical protein FRUB_09478 [Fimbriiglobus ruber]
MCVRVLNRVRARNASSGKPLLAGADAVALRVDVATGSLPGSGG